MESKTLCMSKTVCFEDTHTHTHIYISPGVSKSVAILNIHNLTSYTGTLLNETSNKRAKFAIFQT